MMIKQYEKTVEEYLEERKLRFGRVKHQRLGMSVAAGVMVSNRILEMVAADLDESDIQSILHAKDDVELDPVINREDPCDYEISAADIAIDRAELGPGTMWKHREIPDRQFFVLDEASRTVARTLLFKGLKGIVFVRDGGLRA